MYQVNKPEPVTKDHKGTEIKPGLRVAYNQSGDVILGTIISLDSNDWKPSRAGYIPEQRWYLNFKLKIKNEAGHISTVKNHRSFVII